MKKLHQGDEVEVLSERKGREFVKVFHPGRGAMLVRPEELSRIRGKENDTTKPARVGLAYWAALAAAGVAGAVKGAIELGLMP